MSTQHYQSAKDKLFALIPAISENDILEAIERLQARLRPKQNLTKQDILDMCDSARKELYRKTYGSHNPSDLP